jgi:adenylylsulfate kinase
MLILMAGLPGTGKSALARRLAEELAATVLDKDLIRAALFPPARIEYSTRQDDFVLEVMFQTAEYLFEADPDCFVILDGRTFTRRYQITRAARFARRGDVPLKIILCTCRVETARQRLQRPSHPAANRDFKLYMALKAQAEPIALPHCVIDTDHKLEESVQQALIYLRTKE